MKRQAARPASLGRKLAVGVVATVLSLLLVEGAVRARQVLKYGTTASTFYVTELDPESGLVIPSPGSRAGPIRINDDGFRSPPVEQPKPSRRIRLAFLGGSTTFCAEASSEAATWPARVAEGLRARYPGVAFDYVNGGAAAFTTEQSRINLEKRVARFEPDVIVIYHATNDLSRDSRALAVEQGLLDADVEVDPGGASVSLAWYLFRKNVLYRTRQRERGGALLAFEPSRLAERFRGRLERLLREADAVAGLVVVPTFSIRARAGHGPDELRAACASSMYYMPYMDPARLLAGFAAYNAVLREAVPAAGALLVEGEDAIPGDALHFHDSVHFTDAGCARMAERLLEALGGAPRFEELLRQRAGWAP